MAWKNLKQRSLADDLVSEHEALTELDDVNDFMDWQAIEDILCDIHAKRLGNSSWLPLFMFRSKAVGLAQLLKVFPCYKEILSRYFISPNFTPDQWPFVPKRL
jgi:hypothetical protein